MTVAVITFIILFATSLTVHLLVRAWRRDRNRVPRARLREKIREFAAPAPEEHPVSLVTPKRDVSGVPFLKTLLARMSWIPRLERLLRQAGVEQSPGVMVLLIAFLALLGFFLGSRLQMGGLVDLAAATILGSLPLVVLQRLKRRRVEAFQRQLPEALDLIGRALRAGHALTSGMKLAAENFKDPLGQEFTQTVAEINFGTSVSEALKNFAKRMECPDLKFFVVAVILQRETGGNLAEIIESMSRIIRERFAFEEKVHALTAEGRVSANIIAGLVCVLVGMLYYVNPTHFDPLLQHPTGKYWALGAVVSVVAGVMVMNRMSKGIKL